MWLYRQQIFTWNVKPYFLRINYLSLYGPKWLYLQTVQIQRLLVKRTHTVCHSVINFWLKPLFVTKNVSKFRNRSVCFRNTRVKELTFITLMAISADDKFIIIFLIFQNGDNLHEMSKPVFSEKWDFKISSAEYTLPGVLSIEKMRFLCCTSLHPYVGYCKHFFWYLGKNKHTYIHTYV